MNIVIALTMMVPAYFHAEFSEDEIANAAPTFLKSDHLVCTNPDGTEYGVILDEPNYRVFFAYGTYTVAYEAKYDNDSVSHYFGLADGVWHLNRNSLEFTIIELGENGDRVHTDGKCELTGTFSLPSPSSR